MQQVEVAAAPESLRRRTLGGAVRRCIAAWGALCLLGSAASVSAQTWTVSVNTDNGDTMLVNSLSWAVNQANMNGGTIDIQTNVTLGASLLEFNATSPIIVDGNGFTIDGDGHQIFTATTGTIDFVDLTLTGGTAQGAAGGNGRGGGGGGLGGGGALYVNNGATVSIENVLFQNNSAVGGAGGTGSNSGTNGGSGGGYNDNANSIAAGTGGATGGSGNGANGGYGGGGAGAGSGGTTGGLGNGGGNGGAPGVGGGGGLALGGAVFVSNQSTFTIKGGVTVASSNTAVGGSGGAGPAGNGAPGTGNGGGLYVGIDAEAIFDNSTTDITVTGNIYSNGHITVSGAGNGTVNLLGATVISPSGTGFTVVSGTLNGNTTSLQGTIVNDSYLRFTQTVDGDFFGTISGVGDVLIGGGGTVNFVNANTYTGNTFVEAGTALQGTTTSLKGDIDNSTLVTFQQNFDGTFNGVITGAGALRKTGTGNVAITGVQTYSGATTVDAGKLSVNGSLSSDVFVNSGGSLGGTGTLNGNVTNSGIIAPGNSIGTLTSVGTFTSVAGSTLQIELSNVGNTAGVSNDLYVVTGPGDVVLQGGTVAVQTLTSVGFVAGTRYSFLQYDGSLSGAFDDVTVNTPFLTASLDYGSQDVGFLIFRSQTDYADVAQTYNQQQIAAYLDAQSVTATGDLATVLDQLNLLSAAGARSAFDQMTGAINPSSMQLNLLAANFMVTRIVRNTGFEGDFGTPRDMRGRPIAEFDPFDSPTDIVLVGYRDDGGAVMPVYRTVNAPRHVWNAWTAGYGAFSGNTSLVGNYAAGGSITSLYRYLNEYVKFGIFGAYNYVSVTTDAPLQTSRTNDGQVGAYIRADDGESHFLFAYSAGIDDHKIDRVIQFGTINRTATGTTAGWQNTAYAEAGRRIPVIGFDAEPFFGLQYTYVRRNGYQETGADSLNLAVGGIDADALWSLLGTRLTADWDLGSFEFHTAWLHNYLPTTTMVSTFAGAGGAGFATQGFDLGSDAALLGGGATWNLTERISFAADYDAYLANGAAFHFGSGTMQIRW